MSSTDERFTPPEVIGFRDSVWNEGTGTDPCWHPRSFSEAGVVYTKAMDGLSRPWYGKVWVNPPWSDGTPWVAKLILHVRQQLLWAEERPEAMLCVRNDPSTDWWEDAWLHANAIVFLNERTCYWHIDENGRRVKGGVPAFTSVIFYFGPQTARFLSKANAYGHYGVSLESHENRRRIPTTMPKKSKTKKSRTQILEGTLLQTIAEFARANPDTTLYEIFEAADTGDEAWRLRHNPVMRLRIRDLAPPAVAVGTINAHFDDWANGANGKPAKKKRTRNKKAPAKKKQPAAKKSPKPNGRGPGPYVNAHAIEAWLESTGAAEFTTQEAMNMLGCSRQAALRAIAVMDDVEPLGAGRSARYQLTSFGAQ